MQRGQSTTSTPLPKGVSPPMGALPIPVVQHHLEGGVDEGKNDDGTHDTSRCSSPVIPTYNSIPVGASSRSNNPNQQQLDHSHLAVRSGSISMHRTTSADVTASKGDSHNMSYNSPPTSTTTITSSTVTTKFTATVPWPETLHDKVLRALIAIGQAFHTTVPRTASESGAVVSDHEVRTLESNVTRIVQQLADALVLQPQVMVAYNNSIDLQSSTAGGGGLGGAPPSPASAFRSAALKAASALATGSYARGRSGAVGGGGGSEYGGAASFALTVGDYSNPGSASALSKNYNVVDSPPGHDTRSSAAASRASSSNSHNAMGSGGALSPTAAGAAAASHHRKKVSVKIPSSPGGTASSSSVVDGGVGAGLSSRGASSLSTAVGSYRSPSRVTNTTTTVVPPSSGISPSRHHHGTTNSAPVAAAHANTMGMVPVRGTPSHDLAVAQLRVRNAELEQHVTAMKAFCNKKDRAIDAMSKGLLQDVINLGKEAAAAKMLQQQQAAAAASITSPVSSRSNGRASPLVGPSGGGGNGGGLNSTLMTSTSSLNGQNQATAVESGYTSMFDFLRLFEGEDPDPERQEGGAIRLLERDHRGVVQRMTQHHAAEVLDKDREMELLHREITHLSHQLEIEANRQFKPSSAYIADRLGAVRKSRLRATKKSNGGDALVEGGSGDFGASGGGEEVSFGGFGDGTNTSIADLSFDEIEADLNHLISQLDEKDDKLYVQTQRVDELQAQIKVLKDASRSNLAKEQATGNELVGQLEEAEAEVAALQEQLQRANAELGGLRASKRLLEELPIAARTKLPEIISEHELLTTETVPYLQSQVEQLEMDAVRLEGRLESTQSELDAVRLNNQEAIDKAVTACRAGMESSSGHRGGSATGGGPGPSGARIEKLQNHVSSLEAKAAEDACRVAMLEEELTETRKQRNKAINAAGGSVSGAGMASSMSMMKRSGISADGISMGGSGVGEDGPSFDNNKAALEAKTEELLKRDNEIAAMKKRMELLEGIVTDVTIAKKHGDEISTHLQSEGTATTNASDQEALLNRLFASNKEAIDLSQQLANSEARATKAERGGFELMTANREQSNTITTLETEVERLRALLLESAMTAASSVTPISSANQTSPKQPQHSQASGSATPDSPSLPVKKERQSSVVQSKPASSTTSPAIVATTKGRTTPPITAAKSNEKLVEVAESVASTSDPATTGKQDVGTKATTHKTAVTGTVMSVPRGHQQPPTTESKPAPPPGTTPSITTTTTTTTPQSGAGEVVAVTTTDQTPARVVNSRPPSGKDRPGSSSSPRSASNLSTRNQPAETTTATTTVGDGPPKSSSSTRPSSSTKRGSRGSIAASQVNVVFSGLVEATPPMTTADGLLPSGTVGTVRPNSASITRPSPGALDYDSQADDLPLALESDDNLLMTTTSVSSTLRRGGNQHTRTHDGIGADGRKSSPPPLTTFVPGEDDNNDINGSLNTSTAPATYHPKRTASIHSTSSTSVLIPGQSASRRASSATSNNRQMSGSVKNKQRSYAFPDGGYSNSVDSIKPTEREQKVSKMVQPAYTSGASVESTSTRSLKPPSATPSRKKPSSANTDSMMSTASGIDTSLIKAAAVSATSTRAEDRVILPLEEKAIAMRWLRRNHTVLEGLVTHMLQSRGVDIAATQQREGNVFTSPHRGFTTHKHPPNNTTTTTNTIPPGTMSWFRDTPPSPTGMPLSTSPKRQESSSGTSSPNETKEELILHQMSRTSEGRRVQSGHDTRLTRRVDLESVYVEQAAKRGVSPPARSLTPPKPTNSGRATNATFKPDKIGKWRGEVNEAERKASKAYSAMFTGGSTKSPVPKTSTHLNNTSSSGGGQPVLLPIGLADSSKMRLFDRPPEVGDDSEEADQEVIAALARALDHGMQKHHHQHSVVIREPRSLDLSSPSSTGAVTAAATTSQSTGGTSRSSPPDSSVPSPQALIPVTPPSQLSTLDIREMCADIYCTNAPVATKAPSAKTAAGAAGRESRGKEPSSSSRLVRGVREKIQANINVEKFMHMFGNQQQQVREQ